MNKSITVLAGTMFGGKTARLLQLIDRHRRQGFQTIVVKPITDNRFDEDAVVSHDKISEKVDFNVKDPHDLYSRVSPIVDKDKNCTIFIDETQLIAYAIGTMPGSFTRICKKLVAIGANVVAATLTTDRAGQPWPGIGHLLCDADDIQLFNAICDCCKTQPARYSHRKINNDSPILLGSKELYEARCRACFPY